MEISKKTQRILNENLGNIYEVTAKQVWYKMTDTTSNESWFADPGEAKNWISSFPCREEVEGYGSRLLATRTRLALARPWFVFDNPDAAGLYLLRMYTDNLHLAALYREKGNML